MAEKRGTLWAYERNPKRIPASANDSGPQTANQCSFPPGSAYPFGLGASGLAGGCGKAKSVNRVLDAIYRIGRHDAGEALNDKVVDGVLRDLELMQADDETEIACELNEDANGYVE